jgi:hypothetical protein
MEPIIHEIYYNKGRLIVQYSIGREDMTGSFTQEQIKQVSDDCEPTDLLAIQLITNFTS